MVVEIEGVTYQARQYWGQVRPAPEASMSEALSFRPYVVFTITNPTILFGCYA